MFKLLVQYLNDFEIFGGAIRDLILNVEPNDIDINTSLSKFDEDKNKLASILNQLNIKYKIDYITLQYQSDEISTSGRFCVVRYMMKSLSDNEFREEIKRECIRSGMTPDELVYEVTRKILGK